jgi:hypothetical protein
MRKNLIVTAVLTAGLALCGAGTAFAHHVGGNLNHSTTGASFSGTWDWSHEDQGNGGFNFYGTISDTNCGDGDNVYSKVQVMSYTPNSFYGNACGTKWQGYEVYDYQAIRTTHAEYQVCRDRSFGYTDNCSTKQYFNR